MMWVLALVLGCVPQADYLKLQNQYKRSQTRVERLEADLAAQTKLSQQILADLKDLLVDLKPLIDKGVVTVEVVDGQIVIGLTADVLFPSGSADLSPGGQQTVNELARILSRRASDHEFQVQGHTDSEPISTAQFPDNWALGAARALTVTRAMISQGFPNGHISAASYASYAPVASNSSPEGRQQNRRIELVMLPDLGTLPAFQDLVNSGTQPARKRGKNK